MDSNLVKGLLLISLRHLFSFAKISHTIKSCSFKMVQYGVAAATNKYSSWFQTFSKMFFFFTFTFSKIVSNGFMWLF